MGSYWGNRLLNLDSHYFDRHNFYFSFTYDPYTSENGFISIKAQAHGNGGYSIYQECMPRGFYNRTSAVRMFASIDYAQPTPTGDMQFWEGEVKEIIGETISTNDTIGCDIPPSTGYLPEDITIDHGALRPIYNNRPFVITVRFQTYLVVDATGQGNIDVFMNVPMAWGEVYYR